MPEKRINIIGERVFFLNFLYEIEIIKISPNIINAFQSDKKAMDCTIVMLNIDFKSIIIDVPIIKPIIAGLMLESVALTALYFKRFLSIAAIVGSVRYGGFGNPDFCL